MQKKNICGKSGLGGYNFYVDGKKNSYLEMVIIFIHFMLMILNEYGLDQSI